MNEAKIAGRLRRSLGYLYDEGYSRDCDPYLAVKEAADTIDRLRAELADAERGRDEARAELQTYRDREGDLPAECRGGTP